MTYITSNKLSFRSLLATAAISVLVSQGAFASPITDAKRFWTFDGTTSDSVTGLGGTAFGGASYGTDRDGNAGGALSLDGYDDKVVADQSNDLGNFTDFTLSFWFNMNAHNTAGRTYFFDNRPAQAVYVIVDDNVSGNSTAGQLESQGGYAVINDVNDQAWHNVVISNSVGAGTYNTYFDGVLVSSDLANSAKNFEGALTFGTYYAAGIGGNYWFNGSLDDIALWDRALSGSEVNQLFNASASATPSSVPEPSTLMLLGLGLLGLSQTQGRRKQIIRS